MSDLKRRKLSLDLKLKPLELSQAERQALKAQYTRADPFSHLILSEFCTDDAYLRQVRNEIITHLKADYKETDIFKVLQTKDLANLDHTMDGIDHLLELRDKLYSSEFCTFLRDVTGCPALLSQVDCSCNIYPESGHLLCHDDVIGSRCVSYILYLTDPDEMWTASDGGALELYPVGSNQGKVMRRRIEGRCVFLEVEVEPVKRILPCWNQMVVFRVQPGVSFHSVEEVRTALNHRLSISGWFHCATTDLLSPQPSTLSLLQESNGQVQIPSFTFQRDGLSDGLRTEDIKILEKWVNKIYLDSENIDKIYKTFKEEGSIQLQDFLNAATIHTLTQLLPGAEADALSSACGWEVQGPPHKQRYAKFRTSDVSLKNPSFALGSALKDLELELFQSRSFQLLLYELTGVQILSGQSEIRSFRPGSDYTIALYNPHKQDTLDAVLCFVNASSGEAKAQWEYGEVGGFEAYLLADTKQESAADVYSTEDEDSGVLSVSPVCNTLNLVLADQGLIKFVKYVSASAPSHRWDLSVEYQIAEAEEEEATDDEEAIKGVEKTDDKN